MRGRNVGCRAIVLAAVLLGAGTEAMADEAPDPQVIREGKGDYDWQCAACHGPDGKGDGPMANLLVKQPTDLTGLARANGDKFPFWRVYRIVSGKSHVPGHETFQMPDFWKRFKGQETEFGLLPPHVRVLELTHYLDSIQEK